MSKRLLLLCTVGFLHGVKVTVLNPKLHDAGLTKDQEAHTFSKWQAGANATWSLHDDAGLKGLSHYGAILANAYTSGGTSWVPSWSSFIGKNGVVKEGYAIKDPFTFETPEVVRKFVRHLLSGHYGTDLYVCLFDLGSVKDVRRVHNRLPGYEPGTVSLLWYHPDGTVSKVTKSRSFHAAERKLDGYYWTSDETTYKRAVCWQKTREVICAGLLPPAITDSTHALQAQGAITAYYVSDQAAIDKLASFAPYAEGKVFSAGSELRGRLQEVFNLVNSGLPAPDISLDLDRQIMSVKLLNSTSFEQSIVYLTYKGAEASRVPTRMSSRAHRTPPFAGVTSDLAEAFDMHSRHMEGTVPAQIAGALIHTVTNVRFTNLHTPDNCVIS